MFRHRRQLDDFSAEIESHVQLEIDRLRADGVAADEARAAAHRAFGNVTFSRERFYESQRWLWWDRLSADVLYAARVFRKAPGFTIVAILTVAVGVGATTAIFSVVDATLLHPLPYPHPERLISVEDDLPGVGSYNVGMSQPEWLDLERSGIFENVSPSWYDENNLTGSSQPERVRLSSVSPNYFATLGVAPAVGRAFPSGDRSPGFTGEAIISDAMWKGAFGGNPDVLERSIRLDTDLYRIVGVMPPAFRAPGRTPDERNIDVWPATSFYGPPMSYHPRRSVRNLPGAIARLKAGDSLIAAQDRVDALVAALRSRYPGDYPLQSAWRVRLVPLADMLFGDVRRSLVLSLAAVALVLLIGCVNLANLLLARASVRTRELAVRQALGAGRGRLVRQLLTESTMLSLLGGAAGLALLLATRTLLVQLLPPTLPRLNDITINWTVLLFALAVTIGSGIAFGLAPALHAGRTDMTGALNAEGRVLAGGRARTRTRRTLVAAEFALSLVLMIAAGLLLRSFWDLWHAPLGFDPARVVTIRTRLPYPNDVTIDKYPTPAQEAPFLRELLRRVRALPGVDDAALGGSTAVPLGHTQADPNFFFPVVIQGRGTDPNQSPLVHGSAVTPSYFALLRMTLIRGRLFTDFDDERTPAVAVINEAMARAFWPGADPIGRQVKLSYADKAPWTTIVGVIADARTESLMDGVPEIYVSAYQRSEKHLAVFLSGCLDVAATADRVRQAVQRIDAALPVFGAQTLNETVAASLAERRLSTEMVGAFAVTALLLAALGVYGVVSYMVGERTREIGIRLALGAERRAIVAMVLGEGVALVIVGTGVGLVCALVVSRAMAGLLYGVRPTDAATFAAVTGILVSVALVSCYVPARRATRIDPSGALR